MTYETARVGDVLRLERRPVTPDPRKEYVSIGIRSFGKGIFHYEPTSGDRLGRLRFFEFEPQRLVLSNIKAWEGAVAVSDESDAGCVASNRFLTYRPVDRRLDIGWARWFFLSEHGNELLQRASPGSADRNRTLAAARFESLEIPIPPLDEQRRIAHELDTAEAAAVTLREASGRAAMLNAALAVSLATRPDLPEDERRHAGWRQVRLADVMQPAEDKVRVEAGAVYPNVGIYSFGRGLFEKPSIDGATTSATTLNRITTGQFIYSRLFAFEGAYTHVPPEFDGCYVSNEFPAFNPDPSQLDARWLATMLRSPDRWADLAGRSKGLGVRRQRVPVDAVLDYQVSLPQIAEQRAMVAAIDLIEQTASRRQEMKNRVDALVPAALNEAFAGIS